MASRLAQMQARFQQKQMQEKEEKLLKLYENQQQRAFERVGRGSAGSNTSIGSTGGGGGKVRQMFDERRQKAGIDKSYPLEPLKAKATTTSSRTTLIKTTVKKSVSQTRNGKQIASQREEYHKVYNNNYDDIDEHNNLVEIMNNHNLSDDLDSEELPQIGFNDTHSQYVTGKLANVGGKLPSQKLESKPKTNAKQESKSPAKRPIAKPATPPRSSSSVTSVSNPVSRNSPAKSENMSSKQAPSNQSSRAPSSNRPSARQGPKSPVVRDDLAECKYCGRRFASDRIGVHEDICGKSGKKKRKAYDATKHRVTGTELEGYVLKGGNKKGASGKISAKHAASKGNWRKTHEEFIAAIRSAKQAQAYVAKGGKLSDLPPPPPSSNPDYVQCPHCGRRFNEAAAQRHIPKCATYDYNKPKQNGPPKGRPQKR